MPLTSYPHTRRSECREEHHGRQVDDPYRWLEQPAHVPEVREWIEAQNEVTDAYLRAGGERDELRARLTELWDYPKAGAPWRRGGRYFQFRNTGLQNQDVLFTMDAPTAVGRVLLDPNTLSEDGTASLTSLAVSPDGRYLAYGVSHAGSDWITWRVREVDTLEDLPDELEWSRFSLATWLPDSSGFYYNRYPRPEEGEEYVAELERPELLLHRLRTPQADDELVYSRPDEPRYSFHPYITEDGAYLILTTTRGTERRNLIHYRELGSDGGFVPLIAEFEHEYQFIGNDGRTFYFQTDEGADRGRIVAIDLDRPEERRVVVPELDDRLEEVALLGDTLVVLYQRHASSRIARYDLRGDPLGEVPLPTLGTAGFQRHQRTDGELFFAFTSFLHPTSSYRLDPATGEVELLWRPELPFDPAPYVTRQVFATSRDGTRVPVFLVHRGDLEPTGDHPTLLYGYGGFDVSLTPSFSTSRLVWLERGGVLAVANLRGGGEYGKAWHEAGTVHRKQNVFDDFIACAEHLCELGVTSPERLAIQGGSNGGLLVGACLTQRPDLFRAAHAAVGVLDMLRYHLFTIGWAWASDYGTADDPEEFATLLAYSPLHNLEPGTCYPATLITTGDHDDRVVPAHSFKFAAALQAAQGCGRPTLLRVMTQAGHGHGKPTRAVIEEQADVWAFLLRELGVARSAPAARAD